MSYKDILKLSTTLQAANLAAYNYNYVKKKKKKNLVDLGVTNVIGAGLIDAQGNFI